MIDDQPLADQPGREREEADGGGTKERSLAAADLADPFRSKLFSNASAKKQVRDVSRCDVHHRPHPDGVASRWIHDPKGLTNCGERSHGQPASCTP